MTTISTTKLAELLKKIAEWLGRPLTSKEKKNVQTDLGLETASAFDVNYFIDPDQTPISSIDFKALAKIGVKKVAVRTSEAGNFAIKYSDLKAKVKPLTDAAGIILYAWVWDTFNPDYAKAMAKQGIRIVADIETYTMKDRIPYLKKLYTAVKSGGSYLILCVKAEGWDGGQLYTSIAPYCDKIMPMLYLGDYNKSTTDLANFISTWSIKLKGKFTCALETYQKDGVYTAKTPAVLKGEMDVVKKYITDVWLFRLGLSNYGIATSTTTNTTTDTTTNTTTPTSTLGPIQTKIQQGTGKKFTSFTEFYNLVLKYCTYSYYFDNKKTLTEEINALISSINGKDIGENCVDYASVAQALAAEMNYQTRFIGIYCTQDQINHAYVELKGKEFKDWTAVDLAACASDSYKIGSHWCNGQKTVNPSWIPFEKL